MPFEQSRENEVVDPGHVFPGQHGLPSVPQVWHVLLPVAQTCISLPSIEQRLPAATHLFGDVE